MKQLLKNILGLYFSTAVFAAPPVTVFQEQNPGGYLSRNYVINPGAEKNITAGITNASSILTRSTTTPIEGVGEYSVNATATSQNIDWALNTFQQGLKGQNCEARWTIEGDASLYKAQVLQNSVVIADSAALFNFSTPQGVSINFPCGDLSTTTLLRLTSTGDGAVILVDSVYAGLATNVAQLNPISNPVSYTPTFQGFGTPTSVNIQSWRSGKYLFVQGSFVAGTTTGVEGRIGLGFNGVAGNVTVDPTSLPVIRTVGKAAVSNLAARDYQVLSEPSVTYLTIGYQESTTTSALTKQNGNAINSSGNTFTFFAAVPILGWSAETVYRPDQGGIQWTSFTPTGAWSTNQTYSGRYKCDGDTLEVYYSMAIGGSPGTGATYAINLPSGFTIDTTKLPATTGNGSIGVANFLDNGVNNYPGRILYSSTTAVQPSYFASSPAVIAGVTQTVPVTWGSGDQFTGYYRVPVTSDSPCSRLKAPLLVGSVVSKSTGVTGLEYANIAAASGCTLSSNSPGMASVSAPGGSECAVLFASNTFTSTPVCTCSTTNGTANRGCYIKNASSSGVSTQVFDSGSTNQNTPVSLVCVGPR